MILSAAYPSGTDARSTFSDRLLFAGIAQQRLHQLGVARVSEEPERPRHSGGVGFPILVLQHRRDRGYRGGYPVRQHDI